LQREGSNSTIIESKVSSSVIDPADLKMMMMQLLQNDEAFKEEVSYFFTSQSAPFSSPKNSKLSVEVDMLLLQEFKGAQISNWQTTDMQGTVFGWPEEISAKLVKHGNELFIVPLSSDGLYGYVDRADLAVLLRVSQLYELMNRFTLTNQRPRLVVVGTGMSEPARKIADQISVKFLNCI